MNNWQKTIFVVLVLPYISFAQVMASAPPADVALARPEAIGQAVTPTYATYALAQLLAAAQTAVSTDEPLIEAPSYALARLPASAPTPKPRTTAQTSAPQNKGAMHFFDALPETTAKSSNPVEAASSQELDQLIEQFGGSNLKGFKNLDELHIKGSAEQKAWMVQRLIEYRLAYKQGAPGSNVNLAEDLEWAAKQGVAYPDTQMLSQVEKSFSSKDMQGRLQYAMTLQEPLRRVALDGLLSTADNASVGTEFLVKNGHLFSPQRKNALSVEIISNMSIDVLSDKDLQNVRTLNRSIDYTDKKTICRSAGMFALSMIVDDVSASSLRQKEYYQMQGRGLVEMKRRNLKCEPFDKNEKLADKVAEQAEAIGAYPRGYFAKLQSDANAPAPVANLGSCQIDRVYEDEVKMEMNILSKVKTGNSRLFGQNSKGQCSLQIIGKKTAQGYHARIVLFGSNGQQLIKMDRDFDNLTQLQDAALYGKEPMTLAPLPGIPSKASASKELRASSAK